MLELDSAMAGHAISRNEMHMCPASQIGERMFIVDFSDDETDRNVHCG